MVLLCWTKWPLKLKKEKKCFKLNSPRPICWGGRVVRILRHWGVQLILAYSWTRPAILVAGKGKGRGNFISSVFSLSFLFLFLTCPTLSSLLLSLLFLFFLSLGDDTKWPTRVEGSLNSNTIKKPRPIGQFQNNFPEIILGWPPTEIAKMVPLCWTKWLLELKIEKLLNNISSQANDPISK